MLEGLRVSFGVATRLQRSSPDQPMMYKDWVIPPGVSSAYSPHPCQYRPLYTLTFNLIPGPGRHDKPPTP